MAGIIRQFLVIAAHTVNHFPLIQLTEQRIQQVPQAAFLFPRFLMSRCPKHVSFMHEAGNQSR